MDKFEIVENAETVEVTTRSRKVGFKPAEKGRYAYADALCGAGYEFPNEVAFAENEFDHQYKDNLRSIMQDGEKRTDRTGVNTISVFGDIGHKIDLRRGYPGTTLKRLAFEANKVETIDWMLQGKTDLKTLKDKGVRIWDQNVKPGTEVYEGAELTLDQRLAFLTANQQEEFAEYRDVLANDPDYSDYVRGLAHNAKLNNWGIPERALSDGDLGPIYGKQWRAWEDVRVVTYNEWMVDYVAYEKRGFKLVDYVAKTVGVNTTVTHAVIRREIDQVAQVEKAVAERSDSRRIILTGWNVAQLDEMSLPPCHTMAQWSVSQKTDSNGKQFLDCKLYQRSADMLLGVPFNIAQYALITEMLAHVHGLTARFLHHTIGDAHIYQNHIDKGFVQEIMERPVSFKSPTLSISGTYNSITEIPTDRIWMVDYQSHEAQKNVPIAK